MFLNLYSQLSVGLSQQSTDSDGSTWNSRVVLILLRVRSGKIGRSIWKNELIVLRVFLTNNAKASFCPGQSNIYLMFICYKAKMLHQPWSRRIFLNFSLLERAYQWQNYVISLTSYIRNKTYIGIMWLIIFRNRLLAGEAKNFGLCLDQTMELLDWFPDKPWASTTVVTEMSFKLCFFNSSLISKHWARYGDRTRMSSSLIPSFASWRATWTWKYKHCKSLVFCHKIYMAFSSTITEIKNRKP